MILLCGIPSETPLSMVHEALVSLGETPVLLNQRRFAETQLELDLNAGRATGWLHAEGAHYRLEDFRGIYMRLMDDRFLPELEGKSEDAPERAHCRDLHDALSLWLELAGSRVVNRPSAMTSNNSKPYQAQLIRESGLMVPETLVTNDPDRVAAFRQRCSRVIYKSISGVRSVVQELGADDAGRLDRIRWCPTQFQELIEGTDVRVHVVGQEVWATRIRSRAVDYRYARDQVGEAAVLEECELPEETVASCVALAGRLGLAFAGIDLRLCEDGRVYCFEVNPSPGFSYYEANTGQPIALGVARHLRGPHPGPGAIPALPGGG